MLSFSVRATVVAVATLMFFAMAQHGHGAEPARPASAPADANASQVPVKDGIVQPRLPVADSVREAMELLKKADDGYKPGSIDGPLASYFTSCYLKPDGTRTSRNMAFPARHHAYFINTFLLYAAYTGATEWVVRAKDLGDWNIAHSTPADAKWANLPWSAYDNDKGTPGGSADKDATEPDKAAFIGTAYLNLHDATKDPRYLDAARKIARTLIAKQNEDGSWPFRVVPKDGTVRQEFGGAPVFFVQFFQALAKHDTDDAAIKAAYDTSLKLMIARNIEKNEWGTYHEDVQPKPNEYPSAEPISFTADWLFRNAKQHPEYIDMGRKILRSMEERLVHTSGHPAAPAPAVSEQAGYEHMMPGHTARYCAALTQLYVMTGDKQARDTALSGFNAATYMQNESGLFATYFQILNARDPNAKRPNWISQHLYTVCHVLEAAPYLPELKMAK